ncbi:MAG TPA: NAD(P)H-dependent oxidoreductase [Methanomassiliicoccales archaeon]|nr:NAD(P)H-dependent oxidoreductase [Methanomassiliicoccales archaeon]
MKILAIMGSPNKGGTGTKVVQEIARVMGELGPVDIELLHLKDEGLGICRGCFACVSKGEDRCPMAEERVRIEKRIEAADGILLISPGYVQNVSGLMKNFMDRMAYTNHRPRFFGKKVMIVANGGARLDKTLDGLRIAIGGPEVVSELAYIQVPWPMQDRTQKKSSKALRKAAVGFHQALKDNDRTPSFGSYMRFRFFKEISADMGPWLPADHEFYGKLDSYYYDVKIGAGMRLKAAIVMPIGKFFMRGMAPAMPMEREAGRKNK